MYINSQQCFTPLTVLKGLIPPSPYPYTLAKLQKFFRSTQTRKHCWSKKKTKNFLLLVPEIAYAYNLNSIKLFVSKLGY